MKYSIIKLLSTTLILGILFVGCDLTSTSSEGPSEVQVRMQVQTGQNAAKLANVTGSAQNGVVINEVKMFIEEMELESIQNDSLDFEIENFIVNLPLDGSPLILTERQIPAGLYDEFELEIEKPDDEDVMVNDPDFRDETGSYSLVVRGTYNGEDFMFRSSEDFEIDIDLNPPLEISEEGGNSILVISVDLSSWFKGDNGEDLDPKDPSNTERINENIEESFEGFEDEFDNDDDEDDDDDDDD